MPFVPQIIILFTSQKMSALVRTDNNGKGNWQYKCETRTPISLKRKRRGSRGLTKEPQLDAE